MTHHSSQHSGFPTGKYGRDIRGVRQATEERQLGEPAAGTAGVTGGGGYGSSIRPQGTAASGYQQEAGPTGAGAYSSGTSPAGYGTSGYGTTGYGTSGYGEGAHEKTPGRVHGMFEKVTGGIERGVGKMFGSPAMAMRGEEKRSLGQMEMEGM